MSTTPINPAPTNPTSTTSTPGNPTWNTLSLDESLASRTAATRLATDFDGVFGAATIERFLHSSFDQFALRATVVRFLGRGCGDHHGLRRRLPGVPREA